MAEAEPGYGPEMGCKGAVAVHLKAHPLFRLGLDSTQKQRPLETAFFFFPTQKST